ncbi:MAG: HNH endonuclease [Chloroflexi bacterium]|nr:HNH endonuclease [Chloroflexota bacterium]
MATPRIPAKLRREIRVIAKVRCEYCQSAELLMGVTFEVDHIVPLSAGGKTEMSNVCLACPSCNRYKGARQTAFDSRTRREVTLFHPRQQQWTEHFAWSDEGTHLNGITPIGRATVEALQMNRGAMIQLRHYWVTTRKHPPK